MQDVRVITEGEMFRLIVSSKLPAAERTIFDEIMQANSS